MVENQVEKTKYDYNMVKLYRLILNIHIECKYGHSERSIKTPT